MRTQSNSPLTSARTCSRWLYARANTTTPIYLVISNTTQYRRVHTPAPHQSRAQVQMKTCSLMCWIAQSQRQTYFSLLPVPVRCPEHTWRLIKSVKGARVCSSFSPLLCLCFSFLPLPLPSSPGLSLTARLAESRYSPFLPVCVYECVCERRDERAEPVRVCASLSQSILQSCPATAAAQADGGAWLVGFQINPRLSDSDRPPCASPYLSLHYLSLLLCYSLSLLTRDYIR